MFRKLLLFIFCGVFFYTPSVVFAEQIDLFSSEITVNQDGTISVVEKISYDFGNEQRHGIFRTIPLIKNNQDGKQYIFDLTVVSVSDPYTISKENNIVTVKIGDPDKTITGIHHYTIAYTVSGALTYFSDHDEMYWNVTGNEWDVMIQEAQSVVTVPGTIDTVLLQTKCFTGVVGSIDEFCKSNKSDKGVRFVSDGVVSPSEGLTIVVGFPKGIVAEIEPKEYISFFDTVWGGVTIALLLVLGIFWYLLYPIWIIIKWWTAGRDPQVGGPVAAWYDPPMTKSGRLLLPAEAGTLIDETVNIHDISATIVDLARRGYLKIDERKKNDFYLIKSDSKNTTELVLHEKKLLDALFVLSDDVRLKDKKLTGMIEELETIIYNQVVEDGFFDKNPRGTRTFYTIIGGAALFSFNLQLALIAFVIGRHMPKKTLFGAEQAMIARSLKNFLKGQERQLAFQAKNQMWFEKLLPYAVAFGVETYWAQQFKDIARKTPEWFTTYDHHPFNSILLTSRLHSSMNSFESVVTPTRSSTGFSSGFSGGSSGGGGGGGGGGSW